jgi:hypothetical protein
MSIGDVFAKAWELWRRDIGWLILAGLVVGLIVGVVAIIVFSIVAGMLAVSVGGIALGANNSSTGLAGLGIGTLIAAIILGVAGYLIVSVLAMVFYGGMFEMVIGAARESRGVNFADLFGGFRKFGSFIVFWLVIVGISIACGIVMIIPVIGWIAVPVFAAWLGTTWLYVLPLIADRGLTFGEAARTSSQMVKGVGWWKTFGTIIVLSAAFFVVLLVISALGRASSALSSILTLIFEIAAGPFAICYISTMYLGSAGEAVLAPAGGYVVPVPPAYGAAPYVTPPAGGQAYQPIAPPPIAPPAAQGTLTAATATAAVVALPLAEADAWKAAADPLAPPPSAAPAPTPPLAPPPAAPDHVASEAPTVDVASGQLEKHCSECGALIEGSDEFCQSCALEVSGGEPQTAETSAIEPPVIEPATQVPAPPEAPAAPEAPKT